MAAIPSRIYSIGITEAVNLPNYMGLEGKPTGQDAPYRNHKRYPGRGRRQEDRAYDLLHARRHPEIPDENFKIVQSILGIHQRCVIARHFPSRAANNPQNIFAFVSESLRRNS
jgi:hypothetical protein